MIKVGDRVVHPRHGLGQVTNLAVKQFVQGQKRPFYEISFPGSTLWIPMNHSGSGIRKLTVKSEISDCRRLLAAPAAPLNRDPRLRQADLSHHLKEGTLRAQCEVVRDLNAAHWNRPLNGSMATLLKAAQEVLCQEWAAVEGISVNEAAQEIEDLLDKGRRAQGKD